jgi:hypothetical protein
VPAGNQRELLLQVADRLSAELGPGDGGEAASAADLGSRAGPSGVLSPEDESLAMSMRQCLAKVAAGVAAGRPRRGADDAVRAALDGAELVIRGELVTGNADHLVSLMPSFVFLITLPIVDQDEALELARRAAELVEDAR